MHIPSSTADFIYTRFRGQSDYARATSVAERFIRLYPNNRQLDYAYYLRGVANMEIGFDSLLRYTSLQQAIVMFWLFTDCL